jgi:hypothetical protein
VTAVRGGGGAGVEGDVVRGAVRDGASATRGAGRGCAPASRGGAVRAGGVVTAARAGAVEVGGGATDPRSGGGVTAAPGRASGFTGVVVGGAGGGVFVAASGAAGGAPGDNGVISSAGLGGNSGSDALGAGVEGSAGVRAGVTASVARARSRLVWAGTFASSSGTRASAAGRRFNCSGISGVDSALRSGVDHFHPLNGPRWVAFVTSQIEAPAIMTMPPTYAMARAAPILGAYSYSTSVKSTPSGRSQSGSSPSGGVSGGVSEGLSGGVSGGGWLYGLKRRSYSNCSFMCVC